MKWPETLLPTTVLGSHALPGWFLYALEGVEAGRFGRLETQELFDDAVDTARDEYGIDLPLIDLAVSDPYKDATAKVQGSRYYGISPVLGVLCHHLAFTQENVDWQIWIEDGPQPLIRKFVITYKNEPGQPEFTAFITHWDITDPIADSDFVFSPPVGASKIEMRKPQ